jgi:hypothetical protein
MEEFDYLNLQELNADLRLDIVFDEEGRGVQEWEYIDLTVKGNSEESESESSFEATVHIRQFESKNGKVETKVEFSDDLADLNGQIMDGELYVHKYTDAEGNEAFDVDFTDFLEGSDSEGSEGEGLEDEGSEGDHLFEGIIHLEQFTNSEGFMEQHFMFLEEFSYFNDQELIGLEFRLDVLVDQEGNEFHEWEQIDESERSHEDISEEKWFLSCAEHVDFCKPEE